MKTNQLLMGLLLTGGIFSMNAQNVASTANLTSGGNSAGTAGGSSTYYGHQAGKVSTGSANTFLGYIVGPINSTGSGNTFIGQNVGAKNTTGGYNIFMGSYTAINNSTGEFNTFLGTNASNGNTTGNENVAIGYFAGMSNKTGNGNVFLGCNSGGGGAVSMNNTHLGYTAGQGSLGSRNVFLGNAAGRQSTENDKLFIDNTSTATPLIWGDFALDQVKLNGKVGVGGVTAFPTAAGGANLTNYQLFVKGGVLAEEVRVATTWADYVFEDNYALPTLEEVECFIAENGHLPNVPSAKQVAEEGISLGDIAKVQQEKIEELTLYVIEQKKALNEQQSEIEVLKAQMKVLMEKK
ncbi:hypothetical protein [Flavobacterium cerinum]|uniref:BZIP transcription factor n=1 Tax=Flavobacterium cerinum TaxID=2502784 RepID=A0A3S4T3M6_9FLAO|nr:hypothetical protein [Flavobacterium cerinum]RWX03488.1 hypothetical protein EPI11_00735 [Flavobacterium cerinum]